MATPPPETDRYSRQVLFPPIGPQGQERLAQSRVTLIGCGALGCLQASMLVRAGVGHLRICDRDFIETNNLQRQILFDERDVADQIPKAEAARRKLLLANSAVTIESLVADVNHTNIERFVAGADVIADGTDNFETRFLINDLSVKHNVPWVYGAVIAATGLVMPVVPGQTPCLRCVFETPPPPGTAQTCDTAGILGPTVGVVASLQVAQILRILVGQRADIAPQLISVDVWDVRFQSLAMAGAAEAPCPCCKGRDFAYLRGSLASQTTALCGRNAVQVTPPAGASIRLATIAERVAPLRPVTVNPFLVRFCADGLEITVFQDGRAIVRGTDKPALAKAAYARYVGH